MLRQLRSAEKMKRILWIGLLVLIIPSMVAFYGFGSGDMGSGLRKGASVATINYPDGSKGTVGSTELRFAKNYLENRLARYAQDQGTVLDSLAVSELTGNRALLDQAINLDMLRHYAEKNELTVSKQEVMEFFQSVTTADQRRQLLEQWRMQGRTADSVMEEERKGRVLQKAADSIGSQVRVTHYEAWQDYRQQKESIVAEMVKFNPSDYVSSVTITDAGLKEYFDKNVDKFRVADQAQYDYVLLRKDDMKSSITVTNDEITSYYNARKEDFRLPRKVLASQILLKIPTPDELNTTSPAALTSATAAITQKADELYERAAKGEDFAKLADEFSQEENFPPHADAATTAADTVTTAGGNLGTISEDVATTWYGDQWTSAVFAMNPGSITKPIRTQQGIAIVQVNKIIEGEIQPLDKVKPVVENKIRDEKVEPLFEQAGEKLQKLTENISGGLDKIAAQTSTTIKTTPKVNVGERFMPGIGLLGEFEDPIADLDKGSRSDVLSDSQRHLVVQMKEEFPAHNPPLEEVKPRVEQAYKMSLAEETARKKAEELLAKSKDFKSFEQAVKDAGTTYTRTRPFLRPEVGSIFGGLAPEFMKSSATVKKGSISLTPIGRPGQQQSFVVWHASEVTEPSKTEFSKELDTINERLAERKREVMVLEYMRDQRKKLEADIEIDDSFL